MVRRVVTGHDGAGRAIVASDEDVPPMETAMPGFDTYDLWGADGELTFPDRGEKPPYGDFFPPRGGFRYIMFRMAPDALPTRIADDAEGDNMAAQAMVAIMGDEKPGMHRTESVDMLFIHQGACQLELDDGALVTLKAGDAAVQSGTIHAWSNPFQEECVALAVMVSARQR